MLITLISASEKKARVKVRRVASKYLFQIGHDVWQGRLSAEGLQHMADEIKKKSSKYTSVVIWKAQGKKDTVIVGKIGNMKRFDESGRFVYKQKRVSEPYAYSDNKQLNLMSYITELAALFHDLGKATDGFQEKLRLVFDSKKANDKTLISDPVRHELLSVFMTQAFLKELDPIQSDSPISSESVQLWFRDRAESSLQARSTEYQRLRSDLKNKEGTDETVYHDFSDMDNPFDLGSFETSTVEASLLWLILTHHKLPEVDDQFKDVKRNPRARIKNKSGEKKITLSASASRYVNTRSMDRIDQFFSITDTTKEGCPWLDEQWCDRVVKIIGKIRLLKASVPVVSFKEASPWVTGLIYIARPSLVFADHRASSRKKSCLGKQDNSLIFANTDSVNGRPVLADLLSVHLMKTDWDAARYFNTLFRKDRDPLKNLGGLSSEHISKDLTGNRSPAPFDWQNRIDEVADAIGDAPSLSVILAQTGTGKTRGCIKLASALNPNEMRCTVGLGLRALADQTYNAYLEPPISLPENSVGRVIGSYYPIKTPVEKSIGTSASEQTGDQILLDDSDGNPWEDVAAASIFVDGRKGARKKKKIFLKPVTSMTIDNIINAVSVRTGGDMHILMHLMHSDLVIDEIDNFSPTDMSFVAMLVHLMGFYGRKVILATATMNEVIVKAMSDAYRMGLDKRRAFYPVKTGKLAFIRSEAPFFDVKDLDEKSTEYYRGFLATAEKQDVNTRHKSEILECVEPGKERPEIFQSIMNKALELSEHHSEKVDGIDFSTGFIRFNNVKNSQAMSHWLSRQPTDSDTHVEIVCYHAKTTGFERYIQEHYLNHLMSRKGNSLPEDVQKCRNDLFDRARKAGKSRVTLMVITTNIIEVGRDHCYDWAILEPASLASYIQSIGRVLRHRKQKVVSKPNIAVLNKPVKASVKTRDIWAYPGIETPDVALKTRNDKSSNQVFYHLRKSLSPAMSERASKIGLLAECSDESEAITSASEILGPALDFPTNRWVTTIPQRYSDLPEQSLNLIRLSDYLISGGHPSGKKGFRSINAGNIIDFSGYQLAMSLGQKVRFRHSQGQVTIACQTLDGSYGSSQWVVENKGAIKSVGQVKHLNDEVFLLSHISAEKDRHLEDYWKRLGYVNGEEERVYAYLFSVTLFSYETDEMYFNAYLGVCQKDINQISSFHMTDRLWSQIDGEFVFCRLV